MDGRIVGIGGVCFPPYGPVLAFAKLDEEARRFPVALHKAGLRLMAELAADGITTVSTVPDEETPAARRWLARLGFQLTERVHGQEVWTWRK